MLGSDRLCSLELDDDFSFNEKVGIELANDSLSKVNMDRMLALHLQCRWPPITRKNTLLMEVLTGQGETVRAIFIHFPFALTVVELMR